MVQMIQIISPATPPASAPMSILADSVSKGEAANAMSPIVAARIVADIKSLDFIL